MTFGSLFAGIGGFDLGFERAGMSCSWQVEIDPYCQRVLAKHWPDVRRHGDVKTFPPTDPEEWRVDVICGGFPCQDISYAGKQEGIDGERSGLWSEFARIVRVVRPRLVVVENVAALLDGGLGRVLGDLAACGFDAEWDCLPASAFGAYHERDRVFVVAHDPSVDGRPHGLLEESRERRASFQSGRLHRMAVATRGERENTRLGCEPGLARLVHRLPGGVDRRTALGNTIDPRVAEWVGRRLMASSESPS